MTDTESLIKDIKERDNIIRKYNLYGLLDRDDAIRKIMELRAKDKKVLQIAIENMTGPITLLDQLTNDQLAKELSAQITILLIKLMRKTSMK